MTKYYLNELRIENDLQKQINSNIFETFYDDLRSLLFTRNNVKSDRREGIKSRNVVTK